MNLAADDSSSDLPTAELIRRYLPKIHDIRVPLEGRISLLSSEKAKRLLGWEAQYRIMEQ